MNLLTDALYCWSHADDHWGGYVDNHFAVTEMIALAQNVIRRAYAPYSGFAVSAIIRSDSGAYHAGCNVENIAYPLGMCAETVAIGAMVAAGEQRIEEVLVMAKCEPLIVPCGGCLQRLREFGAPSVPVHLCDLHGVRESTTLGRLLPLSFGQAHAGSVHTHWGNP